MTRKVAPPERPRRFLRYALRYSTAALLSAASCLWGALPAQAQPDAFYYDLLRSGTEALSSDEAQRARFDLRIACFGLMDDLPTFAECLVQLGRAEAALGLESDFRKTFERIAAVERVAPGTYTRAALSSDDRSDYEAAASRWLSESRLSSVAVFQPLAIRAAANRLVRMPTDQRRAELEKLVEESPNVSRWRLMLGDVYLEERLYDAAIEHAQAVLAVEAGNPRARCLQGLAYADSGRCAEAVEDLSACPGSRSDRPTAITVLNCQISLERWQQAQIYFDALPEAVSSSRRVTRLGRQIEAGLPTEAEETAEEGEYALAEEIEVPPLLAELEPDSAAPQPGGSDPEVADASQESDRAPTAEPADAVEPLSASPEARPTGLSPADLSEIRRAEELAIAARYKEDVEVVLEIVRPIARSYPEHQNTQSFAGELAYRAGLWSEAIEHLRRLGPAINDDRVLLFYLAVSYFESGRLQEAREAFRSCCSDPDLSPVIESYRVRILGS